MPRIVGGLHAEPWCCAIAKQFAKALVVRVYNQLKSLST